MELSVGLIGRPVLDVLTNMILTHHDRLQDYMQFSDGMSMGNKNVQLQQVGEHFDTPRRDIIFFDDDKNNIRCAIEFGINAR